MKATVDSQTCRGCGFCARMARGVFEINANGKAYASDLDIPEDLMEFAEMAAEECPESSIEIY
ncbi:MAG: ferredoxin [Clostridia bacterium]